MPGMTGTTAKTEKRCNGCGIVKPVSEFWADRQPRGDGLRYRCKACDRVGHRRFMAARPDYAALKMWKLSLSRHGLTVEQYGELLAEQGGGCAICGRIFSDGKRTRLAVDHCHATGIVRGILCGGCNGALGLLGDDPDRLRKAAEYLERRKIERAA